MLHVLKTIDAHVAGEPLRLITEGLPRAAGKTMAQKCDWMKRHADQLRRALVLEPRGHRDMCAALLTEPVSPGADAGVIFLQNDGYSAISGHGIIAVATIALERGLFPSNPLGKGPSTSLEAGRNTETQKRPHTSHECHGFESRRGRHHRWQLVGDG